MVEVLKSLTFLAKSKSLSFREKRMLDRAKFLVVSEITEVMGQKVAEIEIRVEQALEACFATKARNTVKPKAAPAPTPVPVPVPVAVKAAAPKAVAAAAAPAPKVASKPAGRRARAS